MSKQSIAAATDIPPLKWSVLTYFYDAILVLSGLGNRFREKILAAVPASLRPSTVVDVGSGTGTQFIQLRKRYPEAKLIGIEPDAPAIAICKNKLHKHSISADVLHASATAIPLEDSSIELCISTLTLHHMDTETKKRAFREIFRILQRGGYFILTDWGTSPVPFMRHLLLFENKELLHDHFAGRIPGYAKDAGFTLCSSEKIKVTGIHTWVLHKPMTPEHTEKTSVTHR